MRKLRNYYLSALMIAGLGFMSSCGDDSDDPNPKATITLDPSAETATMAPGQAQNVKFVVTSTDKLKEFKLTKTISGVTQEVIKTTDFPKAGYEYTLTEAVPQAAENSVIAYTATATTTKDEVTTRTYTVTVKSYETYTAKILGNPQASAGSFFSTSDGSVITTANSASSSDKIDFGYYYQIGGTVITDMATLGSPMDANMQAVYSGISSWTTKNATMFNKSTTAAYTAATSGTTIADAYMNATGTASSRVTKLAVGDVVAMMLANGKHAVAKVTALTAPTATANASTITLEVKVQR